VRSAPRRRGHRSAHHARRARHHGRPRRCAPRGVTPTDARDAPRSAPRSRRSPAALPSVSVRALAWAARDAHGRRSVGRGARAGTSTGLEQLLATKEIVVFCGWGGVGKTSVAAAAAVGAASRLGGKVLVLTIDPAKRLATALGIEALGNRAHQVPP